MKVNLINGINIEDVIVYFCLLFPCSFLLFGEPAIFKIIWVKSLFIAFYFVFIFEFHKIYVEAKKEKKKRKAKSFLKRSLMRFFPGLSNREQIPEIQNE